MGFEDFFIKEKKDDFLAFVLRNEHAYQETTIARITETTNRYAEQGWRARVVYDFSTWLGAVAYENERDVDVLNIGRTMSNYAAHRSVMFPGMLAFNQIIHEQRFRVNGKMPPKFCDFEIWRQEEVALFENLYGDQNVRMRDGPAKYMRTLRVPFSVVKPDI